MAKQLVGPVERHVEKVVVGVAGLFLIGVLALYLVSSPNKIQIEGTTEPVAPSGIDALLAQKANQVREQIRAAKGKVETPAPVADKFVSSLDPFKSEKLHEPLAGGAALGPAVPIIDAPTVIEGSAKLVDVLPLAKPQVNFGRSTVSAGAGPTAVNWVTVSSILESKKQIEAQGLAYGETRKDLIYASVDLQRRAQRLDGSWSDEDWEDVESWPIFEMPDLPELTLEGEGKKIAVPKENMDALQRFRDYIQDPGRQISILRPLFIEVLNGSKWALPKLTPYRQLLINDDEIRSPRFESETLEDRYGMAVDAPAAGTAEAPAANEVDAALKAAQKMLASASTEAECVEVFNRAAAILTNAAASAGDKTKARKLQDEAEQKEKDIRRRGGVVAGPKPAEQRPRTLSPQQVVWAHDAAPDSLPSGRTVQYRMRLTLFNRLAGEPLLVRNKEDATKLFVSGPWSEPSDPIEIPATERFFVTACDERKQEINVEMFRWFDGVWVKTRAKFGIGQPLRIIARTPAPAVNNPNEADRPEVEFVADATLMDIDFKRIFREQKKGSGKGGVKFPAAVAECGAVLVNHEGRLEERVVAMDKNHPDKDVLDQMVWKAPRP